MCTLPDFFCHKVRFNYTSTVIRSHSCYGKNYAYASRTSCYYVVLMLAIDITSLMLYKLYIYNPSYIKLETNINFQNAVTFVLVKLYTKCKVQNS